MKTQAQKLELEWLQICDRNFGTAPRSFNWIDRINYLSIATPDWAKNDELTTFFNNQKQLFDRGKLVWGHIVQANNLLFKPGIASCPAMVVYALNSAQNIDPDILGNIASKIFALKNTQPTDPQLLKIAESLTDEYSRPYGLFVPSSFALNVPCELTTIFVARKHLPDGCLSQSLLPLIINSQEPKIAAILPSRYWPPAMTNWWIDRS
jgi:hypothetical protein